MGLAKMPVRAASTGKPCFSIYPATAELQRPHHQTTGNLWGRLSPHDGSEGGWAPVALWDPHFAPTDSRFLRWGCRGHPYSGLVSYRHGALGGPPPSTGIGPWWAAPQLICGRGWPGRPCPRPPAPPTRLGSQRRALSVLRCLQPLPSTPQASPGLGAAAEGLAWVRTLQRCS